MRTPLVPLALCTLLLATQAGAQHPAGTPEAGHGSLPSPDGTPAPQQELKTYRDADGTVRTEDGRPVNNRDGNATQDGDRDDSPERSGPGGPLDPSTTPGATE